MRHRSLGEALQQMATTERLKTLLAVAVIVPATMFLAFGWYEYHRSVRDSLQSLDQATRMVHEHGVKVFQNNEVVLERFLDLLGDRSTKALSADERLFHEAMASMVGRFDQIRNMMLWNEDGRPILSSRYYPLRRDVSVADRAFFIRHKKHGVPLSINEPVDGRLGGDRIFNISRLRRHVDGRFAGVVSLSFSPGYFSEFYGRIVGETPDLAIALIREDGEVVARHPAAMAGGKLEQNSRLLAAMKAGGTDGVLSRISGVDGKQRHVAFRRIGSYPLYVAVSRTHAAVWAGWRQQMLVGAVLFVPGSLILMFAIWLALGKTRAEHEAVLHRHEEELKRQTAENQMSQLQKFEALGQLTSGLAHDFSNLLHIVSTNASVIGLMPPEMDKTRHLTAITHAVSTGQALVTHLLAFAHRRSLALEPANLGVILPGMCDLARHSLRPTIKLDCAVDPDIWDVKVDLSELELAVINMVVNSRDAMPGGGTITVLARNIPTESSERLDAHLPLRDFVALSICDEGSGIPDDVLHRVFEPFFTTKQKGKGTGLGLSRVYAYALQLGGTAVAKNRADGGAMVTLYIPRFVSHAETAEPPTASESTVRELSIVRVQNGCREPRRRTASLPV